MLIVQITEAEAEKKIQICHSTSQSLRRGNRYDVAVNAQQVSEIQNHRKRLVPEKWGPVKETTQQYSSTEQADIVNLSGSGMLLLNFGKDKRAQSKINTEYNK